MPYVGDKLRGQVDMWMDALCGALMSVDDNDIDGELNYVISNIVARRLIKFDRKDGESPEEWRYRKIKDAVGAFECAKLEFYRRIGSVQEDKAIAKNGDIKGYVIQR